MKAKQILLYLIIMVLASCKPEEQPPVISYVFSDVSVDAKQTSATITCRNESVDDDKVYANVLLSKNENVTDAAKYPLHLQNDTLRGNINGLEQNTIYYFCFEVYTTNEHKRSDVVHHFETTGGGANVTVTTIDAINITQTSATSGGNVSAEGNTAINARGVCWDTVPNPDILQSPHLVSGEGAGGFVLNITGLMPGTTYYMRAYAMSNNMVYYGNEVHFTTQSAQLPTVTTGEVSNITCTTAQANGNVTSGGGGTVTRRGVCWGTAHEPTMGDGHADNGTGTGAYTIDITGLTSNTTYYVRAYAENAAGLSYGNEVHFTTQSAQLPTVTTGEMSNITCTTAQINGNVTSDGGVAVTERGICWGTEHAPTTEETHATSGTGTGSFSVEMTGLEPGTTYYVRAYAKNSQGTSYGNEVSFATTADKPTVATSEVSNITHTTAQGGGNVTDDGGSEVTERGICWSTSHNPTTSDNHAISGSGTGSFPRNMTGLTAGTIYYVRAYAQNSQGTSYGSEVSFITLSGDGNAPTGAINGLFSVSATQQVYFSQGNLQYIGSAATPYWKFAEHQWDYLGDNGQGSTNPNVDRDLFGWGTSGYNHGAVCYRPWSTSTDYNKYYAYGSWTYHLYDQTGQADWGYNPISNGGNQTNQWRTLTKDEWDYVFNTRATVTGFRYAKAIVNNVNGVILLPDDWRLYYYSLSSTNTSSASYSSNTISATQWSTLEQHGAVFLPAAGFRQTTFYGVGIGGYYWSASRSVSDGAYTVVLSGDLLDDFRNRGMSVRLVAPF